MMPQMIVGVSAVPLSFRDDIGANVLEILFPGTEQAPIHIRLPQQLVVQFVRACLRVFHTTVMCHTCPTHAHIHARSYVCDALGF